jgi:surfactin synthase thioesterase subunit
MPTKRIQLFLLPYAGGSSASFRRLTDRLDGRIEAITVEYSGRGARSREPLASSFLGMLVDAWEYCLARRNEEIPYAIMGYSMGSVMAYELTVQKKLPGEQKHLFLATEVSPQERAIEFRMVKDPTDERVLERARRLGGIDERMLKNERFAEIFIKPMLSDYRNFFSYQFDGCHEKSKIDATIFYCESDTAFDDVKKWEELIEGTLDYCDFSGGHFFINQHYEELANIINRKLSCCMDC